MTLETSRLILRQWQVDDAEELFEYAKDPSVGPCCGWKPHTSVDNSRDIISNFLIAPENYAIVSKESKGVIGSIGLVIGNKSKLCADNNEAEVGYRVGVPQQGKGYVTEATKEMLRHAFEDLNLDKVWCGYYEGNDKSKRVQEKCGFNYKYNIENFTNYIGEVKNLIVQCLTKNQRLESQK